MDKNGLFVKLYIFFRIFTVLRYNQSRTILLSLWMQWLIRVYILVTVEEEIRSKRWSLLSMHSDWVLHSHKFSPHKQKSVDTV